MALQTGLVLLALFLDLSSPAVAAEVDGPVSLTIFWGQGCPHCAAEWQLADDLARGCLRRVDDAGPRGSHR